ncbi:hypothetical protein MGU_10039 [Metarhizium guizhouense ARSEF 977]|uniref:Uncharacterized protein n=1 Tax=Metarhizium guizhouense (strain ARSEF 977) TaxID=1276136 RepID=A0A0B4GSH0_METGA|nr:hypothetical protein MGU_10039 [Metarhizium guizhouense ARSEF 977]
MFDIVLRPRARQVVRRRVRRRRQGGEGHAKGRKYKQWLEEIGFVDVVDVELMVPGNAWPEDDKMREIGKHLVQVQPAPLLSLGAYFGAKGLSGVLDGLAPDMVRDMEDESIRLCWPM